jgi:hypothetical protein
MWGVSVGELHWAGEGPVAAGCVVRCVAQVWVAVEVGDDVVRIGVDVDEG